MTLRRCRLLLRIVDGALKVAPDERATFLERRCGADVGLRTDAETVLRSGERPGGFLDQPAHEFAASLFAGLEASHASIGAGPTGCDSPA